MMLSWLKKPTPDFSSRGVAQPPPEKSKAPPLVEFKPPAGDGIPFDYNKPTALKPPVILPFRPVVVQALPQPSAEVVSVPYSSGFSPSLETFPTIGTSYFAETVNPAPIADTWSLYPAIHTVEMDGFDLNGAGAITGASLGVSGEITAGGSLGVSGEITAVGNISGSDIFCGTLNANLVDAPAVNTKVLTVNQEAPGLPGRILLADNNGTFGTLQTLSQDLYWNNELLAKAGDIQNVADWSLFPALQNVDMAAKGLTNASAVGITDGVYPQFLTPSEKGLNINGSVVGVSTDIGTDTLWGVAKKGVSDAASAQSTANNAVSDAAAAQSTADTAVSDAAAAQGTADTAVSDAAAAQGTADTAAADATAAQGTADTALADATAAQGTADTALADALAAQGTANTAQATALAAQGTANTALADAAAAQGTAATALAAAAAAQGTADTAEATAIAAGVAAAGAAATAATALAQSGVTMVNSQTGGILLESTGGTVAITNPSSGRINFEVFPGVATLNSNFGAVTLASADSSVVITNPTFGTINLAVPAGTPGVTSLNTLTGPLTLVAGNGISVTPAGSNITVAVTKGPVNAYGNSTITTAAIGIAATTIATVGGVINTNTTRLTYNASMTVQTNSNTNYDITYYITVDGFQVGSQMKHTFSGIGHWNTLSVTGISTGTAVGTHTVRLIALASVAATFTVTAVNINCLSDVNG